MHIKVPGNARAQPLDTLATQPERLARLRAFRHGETRAAGQRRHFDLTAKRRRGERNRHLAMQVVAVAFEHRMLLDVNLDVQIAARTAVDARLAVTRRANPHAVVNTRWNLHFQRLRFLHLARAVAMSARLRNVAAGSVTLRASLLDAEKALRHAHGALSLTRRTGFRLGAGLRARALANLTIYPARHANLRVVAVRRLLQRDFHAVAQIRAAINLRTRAPAAGSRPTAGRLAEDVAENIAERVSETAKTLLTCTGHVRIDAGMAVLIVSRALLRIREHFIGLFGLLETRFRILVIRIAVGVMLHRKLAISLLDFVVARILRDAHNLVVIPFRHIGSAPPRLIEDQVRRLPLGCLESRDSCGSSTPRLHA